MSPAEISIRFVRGMDRVSTYPAVAKQAGLRHRFAVVQDTHVNDCPDMFFDETLWRALAAFVHTIGSGCHVAIIESREVRKQTEVPMQTFLDRWSAQPDGDRSPPHIVIVRSNGDVQLCMVTDCWCDVGGPEPYHDSYTYSLYAKADLEQSVIAFLRSAPGHDKWRMSTQVVSVTEGPEPTVLQRIVNWLR